MKWMSWLPRVFSFFFFDRLISVWTHGRVETNYLHDLASLTFIADMLVLAKANLKNMRTVFGRYRTLAFTPVKLVGQMVDFTSSDTRLSYTLFMPFIHICSVCLRPKSRLVKMPKDGGWISPPVLISFSALKNETQTVRNHFHFWHKKRCWRWEVLAVSLFAPESQSCVTPPTSENTDM